MTTESWTITSLFQAIPTVDRKDSAVGEVFNQLSSFNGFGETVNKEIQGPQLVPVTITFTPSTGSTCLSLYPRTKTFTHTSSINEKSCLATTPDKQTWRIISTEDVRFTFERLSSVEDAAPLEVFKNCVVKTGTLKRRGSSQDYGRKLSVGHFSSGLLGLHLPLSPTA